MSHNISELSGRKGLRDNLFDRMGQLARPEGAPEPEALEALAKEFLVGTATTYGAATFYDFTRPENRGKKVYVCNGSACLCAGTQDQLIEDLKQQFAPEEIGHMTCLGRCYENRAFYYDGNNYSGKSAEDLADLFAKPAPRYAGYPVRSRGKAILTLPYENGPVAEQRLRDLFTRPVDEVLQHILDAQLRGRGGAGFPIGMKLDFCRKAPGTEKFIICNADEGDPGAFSDRYLLEERPESVLEGMIIAGYVTGANWGVVYIRAEYPESVRKVEEVIRRFYDSGLLGENILGSGFTYHIRTIHAQGSYLCGEETALINSIEGQRPEVRVRPPYPAVSGLFNRPTVVNNVETLACLPWILQHGGAAYASIGTDKSKGTKLISLDSFFNKPGILEVEMGTPLAEVVHELGGGFREPIKALHIGGPLGGIVPVEKMESLTVDFESFAQGGFLLGHASIVSIPSSMPMVSYLAHLFEFAAYESCGKCFPCRLGTKRAEEMLRKAEDGSYKIDRVLFDDLLFTLQTGSLCAHGGGIPLPVRNALTWFADELKPYFA
jgi:NADH:ubiquinone oxidoreductase subunit F (NADH-binding)